MQAIILAAGMGRRLGELTEHNTKCMVKVHGVTLIERALHQLEQLELQRIVLVVGYEGKKLIAHVNALQIRTPIVFLENPVYDKTNNIYSLSLAKDYLGKDDTLLLESDLIFEDDVLNLLVSDPRDTLALVDKYESWMDGTCLKLGENDRIDAVVPGSRFLFSETDKYYKTVNIYKFSKQFSSSYYIPFLQAYQKALGENEYYEQVLRVIAMLDQPVIQAKRLTGQRWYEIDDIQDLDIAESLFAPNADEQLRRLQYRYGGYWRYPKLLDFCYLVNPYFPTEKLKNELRSSFNQLLTQYPSGMTVNSLLAAKCFGLLPENILVGNGAAELIKSLMGLLKGKTGFIRPTFEEYPNRFSEKESIYYVSSHMDYRYDEGDIISFFGKSGIQNLVLVNPDNPTGNFVSREGVLRLLAWSKEQNIRLIVDESFVDFADESYTLLDRRLIAENPQLFVMKSISKSYGVPGLRLGILASGNTEIIAKMKKDVSIWNINSFAEFFMQILGKYQTDYRVSLGKVREERNRLAAELSNISGLYVLPSQANYMMIRLEAPFESEKITKQLLSEYGILVKDLSSKIQDGQYMRITVRDTADNDRLIAALRNEFVYADEAF